MQKQCISAWDQGAELLSNRSPHEFRTPTSCIAASSAGALCRLKSRSSSLRTAMYAAGPRHVAATGLVPAFALAAALPCSRAGMAFIVPLTLVAAPTCVDARRLVYAFSMSRRRSNSSSYRTVARAPANLARSNAKRNAPGCLCRTPVGRSQGPCDRSAILCSPMPVLLAGEPSFEGAAVRDLPTNVLYGIGYAR